MTQRIDEAPASAPPPDELSGAHDGPVEIVTAEVVTAGVGAAGAGPAIAAAPSEEPRAAAPRTRLLALDGLRLAAALMVVLWHLVGSGDRAWQTSTAAVFGPLHTASRYGWVGVHLFFLISGFVVCMSSWGRSLGDFFVSRTVRLYPAFWFAVLTTTAVITVWPVYQKRLSAAEILANLTMLQELLGVKNVDMSYWSLTVEVLFYLLFAAVVARGLTYRRAVLFCAVWTVMAIAAPGLGFGWLSTLVGARYAPYFIAGIALYLVYRFGANLLLWAIVGLSWMLSLFRLRGDATYLGQPYVVLAAIVSVFFLVMIAVAVGLSSRVKARWLVNAGALTYPLYLIHQVVGLTVIAMLHQYLPAWLFLGSLVVALLVVAWLIHRLVERPVSGWMKRNLTASLARIRSAD